MSPHTLQIPRFLQRCYPIIDILSLVFIKPTRHISRDKEKPEQNLEHSVKSLQGGSFEDSSTQNERRPKSRVFVAEHAN